MLTVEQLLVVALLAGGGVDGDGFGFIIGKVGSEKREEILMGNIHGRVA